MAELKMKLRPFQVPNFVALDLPPGLRQDGFKEMPGIPIGDLTADVLSEMADEWRRELFKKAERPDPYPPVRGREK